MLLMRHIGEFPFARCDGTTLRAYGEVGLNFPQCYLRALKTVPMPVNIRPAARSGVRLCHYGADHSRSFAYWEARHQLLPEVRTIFSERSGRQCNLPLCKQPRLRGLDFLLRKPGA